MTHKCDNNIYIRANGPLICKGRFILEMDQGSTAAPDEGFFLCRCGVSHNKPYCDGSHKRVVFQDGAQFIDEKQEDIGESDDTVVLTIKPNAMIVAKGPLTLQSEDGTSLTTRYRAALCRCGMSNKKPFCDISHKKCGFISE